VFLRAMPRACQLQVNQQGPFQFHQCQSAQRKGITVISRHQSKQEAPRYLARCHIGTAKWPWHTLASQTALVPSLVLQESQKWLHMSRCTVSMLLGREYPLADSLAGMTAL
jgi:hypothetical protein